LGGLKIQPVRKQVHAYIRYCFQHQKNGNIAKIQKTGAHNHNVHGDNAQVGQEESETFVHFIDADSPALSDELHQFRHQYDEEGNFEQLEVNLPATLYYQEHKVHQVKGAIVHGKEKRTASFPDGLACVVVGYFAGSLCSGCGQQLQEGEKADHDTLNPVNKQQGFESVTVLIIIPDKIEVEANKQQQRVVGGEFSDHQAKTKFLPGINSFPGCNVNIEYYPNRQPADRAGRLKPIPFYLRNQPCCTGPSKKVTT
jgi:hypothetical protein